MSERAEVLREFTRTVEHCEFASDDVLYSHGMADEIVRLRARLTTAERERNEARRDRDQWRVRSTEHQCNSEQWHSRAERAERVVEAVRDYFNGEPTDDPLYAAWCAYSRDSSSVRALDAAEGTP